MYESIAEAKEAIKGFIEITKVDNVKQFYIANSLIYFKLSDDQLNRIDEIINE